MTASLKHTFREIETKNANDEISNEVLKGGSSSKDVMRDYNSRLKEILGDKKPRKNAVLGIETIQTFSPEMMKNINIDEWKKDNLKFLEETFGKDNVISAVLHLDEKTPHVTAIILPVDCKNKLNCREVTSRQNLIKYQDDYAKYMEKHALKRGERGSKVKHKSPQKFYAEFNKMVKRDEEDKITIHNLINNDFIPEMKTFESNKSHMSRIADYIDNYKETFKRLITKYNVLLLEKKSMDDKIESLSIRLKNKTNESKDKDRQIENLVETINNTPVLTEEISNELISLRKYKEGNEALTKKKELQETRERYFHKEETEEESHGIKIR